MCVFDLGFLPHVTDEGSQKDMFANGSDEENLEDVDEKQWRIERHERERFLEEQQVWRSWIRG